MALTTKENKMLHNFNPSSLLSSHKVNSWVVFLSSFCRHSPCSSYVLGLFSPWSTPLYCLKYGCKSSLVLISLPVGMLDDIVVASSSIATVYRRILSSILIHTDKTFIILLLRKCHPLLYSVTCPMLVLFPLRRAPWKPLSYMGQYFAGLCYDASSLFLLSLRCACVELPPYTLLSCPIATLACPFCLLLLCSFESSEYITVPSSCTLRLCSM